MADSTGLSKAAKKNQKRRGTGEQNEVDLIQNLRDQLTEAKTNKDHALANELRQKLWIAQDLNAGLKPAIDKDDDKARKLLNTVTNEGLGTQKDTVQVVAPSVTSTADQDEKKMRNLQKKLKKIEELKVKKEAGEKLESNQLKKIETESDVLEEIEHLKKLMNVTVKR
ncbi:uncharacterized protein [Antedon mediterranea]|uniref:uncharacterized protein n=1 Tax=Antedon mediterranea TaxID=105859 RepID=UPI003AF48794